MFAVLRLTTSPISIHTDIGITFVGMLESEDVARDPGHRIHTCIEVIGATMPHLPIPGLRIVLETQHDRKIGAGVDHFETRIGHQILGFTVWRHNEQQAAAHQFCGLAPPPAVHYLEKHRFVQIMMHNSIGPVFFSACNNAFVRRH